MSHRTLVLALAAAMSLPGCAGMAPSDPLSAQALSKPRNGAGDAEGLYFIGRGHQERGRHEEAVRAFRAALAIEPDHAEARNALGASYFALGRVEQAEQQFRMAVAAAPGLPHLRNNLARLYALTGRSPPSAAPTAAPPATSPPAAPPQAASPQTIAAQETPAAPAGAATSQLLSVASNVWELTAAPPALRAAAPADLGGAAVDLGKAPADAGGAAAPSAARAAPGPGRVEVSNGNGVPGLARRVAQFIETQGYRAPRTSNLQQFNQRRTELQYRIGARRQARELAALLAVAPRLVAVGSLERAATVRLVLGRDFKEPAGLAGAAPAAPPANTVAMLQPE